jgi:peptidoglycan/xylan/chitin deacetylase (PgdA/CDA1 family)
MTVEQLKAVEEAGNKVLCHGKEHVNLKNDATTYAERYEEIVGGKQMLEALGFEVDTMVYPNGSFTDEALEITKKHYKYGIATAGYSQWGQQRYNKDPLDPYVIERVNIGSYYSGETSKDKAAALEAAKRNIDICIENNYLCVLMTHIGDAGEDGIAQILELIDYIESKGFAFVDLETGIQAHMPPEQE